MAAHELFKLKGSVEIDTDKAKTSLHKVQDEVGKVGEKFKSGVTHIGGWGTKLFDVSKSVASKVADVGVAVAKTATAAAAATTAAIVAVTKQSIDAYADFEQLTGGVEKIFGESADRVKKYAQEAYKTAGISANEYMENVTGFSASLLQSLGGDTELAADIANEAIMDMSDNANTFGTDIASIQHAYQGFAKGTYNMLDNLKLGYGGTKEEMERLLADANEINERNGIITQYSLDNFSDIVLAIHTIQKETNITGTTTKEAEKTISGSLNAMKASWTNLLVSFADGNGDLGKSLEEFMDSVGIYLDNLVPRVGEVIEKIFGSLKAQAPKIKERLKRWILDLWVTLREFTPSPFIQQIYDVVETAVSALGVVFKEVMEIFNYFNERKDTLFSGFKTLADGLKNVLNPDNLLNEQKLSSFREKITAFLEGLIEKVNAIAEWIGSHITDILSVIEVVIAGFNSFKNLLIGFWEVIADTVAQVIEWISDHKEDLLAIFDAVDVAIEFVVKAIKAATPYVFEAIDIIWDVLKGVVEWIVANKEPIIAVIGLVWDWLKYVINWLKDVFEPLLTYLWDGFLKPMIQRFSDFISNHFEGIMFVLYILGETFKSIADSVKWVINNILVPIIEFLANQFRDNINGIIDFFDGLLDFIEGIFTGDIERAFDGIVKMVKGIWENLPDILTDPIELAAGLIGKAIDVVPGIFSNIVNSISDIWDSIKSRIKLPHFSMSGELSLLPPSIPSVSVDWYAKAMNKGMIVDEPTIFGMNEKGEMLGAGEAGREAIIGTASLDALITEAVQIQTAGIEEKLAALIDIVGEFLPDIAINSEKQIVIDGKVISKNTRDDISRSQNGQLRFKGAH